MAFLQIDPNIWENEKTLDLARRAGLKPGDVVWRLLAVWSWAFKSERADGDVTPLLETLHQTGFTAALLCMSRNRAKNFLEQMRSSGFLDADPSGRILIHNWKTRSGKMFANRRTARERMRRKRTFQNAFDERSANVRRMFAP